METKIGAVKGYQMLYDSHTRRFVARTAEGDEVASALTQEKLEEQIDKLSKQKFTFPIKVIRYWGSGYIDEGRVTSINIDDRSVWFCEDKTKDGYSHRGKHSLGYDSGIYELTEKNAAIMSEIKELVSVITDTQEKIKQKVELLEKPINQEYFGLESRY